MSGEKGGLYFTSNECYLILTANQKTDNYENMERVSLR